MYSVTYSSRVFCFDSGKNKKTWKKLVTLKTAKMMKVWINVSRVIHVVRIMMLTRHWIFWKAGGVKKVKAKLPVQFTPTPIEVTLLRMYIGRTSEGYTQPIGLPNALVRLI